MRLKVGPDDATLPLGTRDSVLMEHCFTLSQGVASASSNVEYLGLRDLGHSGAIKHSWKHLLHPETAWTMLHGDTVPCPKEKSCIVCTHLKVTISRGYSRLC